jgi:hypothetical protein
MQNKRIKLIYLRQKNNQMFASYLLQNEYELSTLVMVIRKLQALLWQEVQTWEQISSNGFKSRPIVTIASIHVNSLPVFH